MGHKIKSFNEYDTDYKPTIVASAILKQYNLSIDQLSLVPIGGFTRAYSKEVKNIYSYQSNLKDKVRYKIEINKEGLYDKLPENLFHEIPKSKMGSDELSMINEIKKRRKIELQVRQFFMPFDVELNHMRLLLNNYEQQFEFSNSSIAFNHIFKQNWPEFSLLNNRQTLLWMYVISKIKNERNNINFINKILNAMFNININCHFGNVNWLDVNTNQLYSKKLGDGALGINTITNDFCNRNQDVLFIEIGPADTSEILLFKENKKNGKILNMIIDNLVALNVKPSIEYITIVKQTILNNQADDNFLGENTWL